MLSTAQLSMPRFSLANMPKWLMITALTLIVAISSALLLLFAFHSPALLVDNWGIGEADAIWVVTLLLDGGLAAVEFAFPYLIPVIGVIWWYIDIVGYTAAVAY